MKAPLTVGTAGHIDHGKTALVKALTGCDTDRLMEEKRRGISIELGFAELDLGARSLSLIDVPGHERFVRTMIAGAGGFDLYLMVVAADDGVMPQTREHSIVLDALAISTGVVALTKCDQADELTRAHAIDEVMGLLPGATLVEVSSRTGAGLPALRDALSVAAKAVDNGSGVARDLSGQVVLHVDRVFTVPGRGTVVTGTLWSGTVQLGDRVTILPGGGKARVRQIQVHGHALDYVAPRQRVALNLGGLKRGQVNRGEVVTGRDSLLRPSFRLNVELSLPTGQPDEHERVQVHHGTREAAARVISLGSDRFQLRLEMPVMAAEGDRVVIRRIAPPATLGGGVVLDPVPPRQGAASVGGAVIRRVRPDDRRASDSVALSPSPEIDTEERGELPDDSPEMLALRFLQADGAMPRGSRALADALGVRHKEALDVLAALVSRGCLVRLKQDIWYPIGELEVLMGDVISVGWASGSLTVGQARDALGITRKYALALLDHLDACKLTVRHGDRHLLRWSSDPISDLHLS